MGYGHPSYIGNHYYGYIKPYWWVYDHPLLWEKNMFWPRHICLQIWKSMGRITSHILWKKTVPNHQPNINVDWDCHPISRLGHHQTKMKPPTRSSSIETTIQILKWRYVSTIFLAIFSGDIPWNLALKNRPNIYGIGTSNKSVPLRHGHWNHRLHWASHWHLLGAGNAHPAGIFFEKNGWFLGDSMRSLMVIYWRNMVVYWDFLLRSFMGLWWFIGI